MGRSSIGAVIKVVAIVLMIIGLCASIITLLLILNNGTNIGLSIAICLGGGAVSLFLNMLLYGYGVLIESQLRTEEEAALSEEYLRQISYKLDILTTQLSGTEEETGSRSESQEQSAQALSAMNQAYSRAVSFRKPSYWVCENCKNVNPSDRVRCGRCGSTGEIGE